MYTVGLCEALQARVRFESDWAKFGTITVMKTGNRVELCSQVFPARFHQFLLMGFQLLSGEMGQVCETGGMLCKPMAEEGNRGKRGKCSDLGIFGFDYFNDTFYQFGSKFNSIQSNLMQISQQHLRYKCTVHTEDVPILVQRGSTRLELEPEPELELEPK